MTFIKWTNSLSVYVKVFDEQHKKLIDLINKTHIAFEKNETNKIAQILDELIEYVRVHFSTEEDYFDKYGYPDQNEHKKEHSDLILQVLDFKTRFDKGEDILNEFLDFLKEWLENHFKTTDQKYVQFFKDLGVQ
jgi:hemerythrin-like metal-binding protein